MRREGYGTWSVCLSVTAILPPRTYIVGIELKPSLLADKYWCVSVVPLSPSTDTHQYLSASSCHPRHCKSAIPYSQALRIRRICSSEENFVRHANELQSHLIHRGYNRSFVHQQIVRAGAICRIDALAPRSKRTKSNCVPLVTTFHPNLPNLRRITKSFFPLLHTSSRLKQAIPETPIVAYRRPKNLRDLLVSAQLKPTEFAPAHGSAACGGSRCLTCQHIQTGTTVRSSTGRIHQVCATATCKTRNVIYLIECKCCRLQYVGETKNPLHIRLNGHRNDINTTILRSLWQHIFAVQTIHCLIS